MFYTPTRNELSEFGILLNLPTIPPKSLLSALIDVYSEFPDVEYEDIIRDIKAGYLKYEDQNFIRNVIHGELTVYINVIYGYLYYNDGDVEVCATIN